MNEHICTVFARKKPDPLDSLNHFTVPFAILLFLLTKNTEASASRKKPRSRKQTRGFKTYSYCAIHLVFIIAQHPIKCQQRFTAQCSSMLLCNLAPFVPPQETPKECRFFEYYCIDASSPFRLIVSPAYPLRKSIFTCGSSTTAADHKQPCRSCAA